MSVSPESGLETGPQIGHDFLYRYCRDLQHKTRVVMPNRFGTSVQGNRRHLLRMLQDNRLAELDSQRLRVKFAVVEWSKAALPQASV